MREKSLSQQRAVEAKMLVNWNSAEQWIWENFVIFSYSKVVSIWPKRDLQAELQWSTSIQIFF